MKNEQHGRVGPGSTEYMKPFGSDVHHKMHFFGRTSSKMSDTPPPGYYNPKKEVTKPRIPSASIKMYPQYPVYC